MKIQVEKKLCLNEVEIQKTTPVKEVKKPTNHIIVIDCSGSMSGELSKIKGQLKNKLPSLVKEDDTVSLIWFSGKTECGLIAEKVKVKNLNDLNRLNVAIDRWLNPIGLTGFVEPLENVLKLAAGGEIYSLFFLTDGCDNQWPKNKILELTDKMKDQVSGAVFVEYGWYCNRQLMTEMAETVGGSLVFCEDFDAYDPLISSTLSKTFKSAKKVEIKVDNPLYDLVFSVDTNGPCTYKVENGKVLVPEGTPAVFYYTEATGGDDISDIKDDKKLIPIYQSLVALSQRMKSKTVKQILSGLGDVKLFKKYANCYGKQNNTDFQKMALEAAAGKMFEEGRKKGLKVDENAFTILDLLFTLSSDENNLFVPSKMKYNRIGREAEDVSDDLTDAEKKELADMTAKAKSASDFEKIQKRMDEIKAGKKKALEFNYKDKTAGYPISNLVWNETRPNVSLQVKCDGSVELPDTAKYVKEGKLPQQFQTHIFRNYTMIRDGIANIDEMPVKLSKATFMALRGIGLVDGDWDANKVYMVNIRNLPTINEKMVQSVSAKKLFELEYELQQLKADQKVYKAFREQWFGKKESEGFKKLYGEEITKWLEEQGLKDYGFSPLRKLAQSTDFYMGVELEVSMKGIGSLPSFNDFSKKKTAGKALTAREKLLDSAYEDCIKFEKTVAGKPDRDAKLKDWISNKEKDIVSATRKAIKKIAEIKFAVVVGQVLFEEFASLEENTLTMDFGGEKVECKAEMKDVEVKI